MIRALTLHQPYATLIATGAKRVETRSWPAPPWLTGERIAIHAGKGTDYLELADEDPFSTALLTAGLGLDIRSAVPLGLQLPRGAVLCTAVLDRCNPITEEGANVLADANPCEYAFGNYSLADGPRWAWVLRDVEVFAEPIYCRGYQKLWTWTDEPPRETDLMDARGLYIIFAGNTATAARCWDDGVVDTDLKRRWEAVSVAVERERQEAIADVIARREGTRA